MKIYQLSLRRLVTHVDFAVISVKIVRLPVCFPSLQTHENRSGFQKVKNMLQMGEFFSV